MPLEKSSSMSSLVPMTMIKAKRIALSYSQAYSAVPNIVYVLAKVGPFVTRETTKCGTTRIRAARVSPVKKRRLPNP